MPVKVYDGTNWVTVAGDGAQGATGASGTAPLTTKGDLLGFDTAANRVAVGTNGQSLVADSTATAGIRWQDTYAAGKNKIINGDFAINQRNFTTDSTGGYGFDRFICAFSGATATATAQTFTLGTAPVSGYEAKNFLRLAVTTGNDFCRVAQPIESVRTFAGQTVTLSFWAKGTNPTTAGNLRTRLEQMFGTGGSPSASVASAEQTFVLTANWTRYSFTFSVPSIAGKTIGTDSGDRLNVDIGQLSSTSTDSWTLDLWGVQLEAGSVATPFTTATGTVQGELAACQRYYYQSDAQIWTNLQYQTNVNVSRGGTLFLPQFMRTVPTLTFFDSPGNSGKISVSASSGGYSDNITPNVFGQNSNAYAYYAVGTYVLGYTSKITASAEL